jgi:membrane-associated phospholipid phosphatase
VKPKPVRSTQIQLFMKTKFSTALFLLTLFACPSWIKAQAPAINNAPDSTQASPPAAQSAATAPSAPEQAPGQPGYDRPVSWRKLLPNIASDQKKIWMFPLEARHHKNWIPAAGVLAVAAGLIAADPHEGAYFRGTSTFNGFNSVFTGQATSDGMIAAPVLLYGAGLLAKDSKLKKTALLAGEAVGDSEVLTVIIKDATKRVRPAAIPPNGNFSDTWFESPGSVLRGHGSFPSGHTIAAFSLATVIARRYGNHRWVPFVAYGLATVVGFSRLTLSAHFLSDVFMGAALGYSVSRFAVLRQ